MGNACSHILCWVSDIHRAVSDYRRAGFEVDYATAEKRAMYAHIWFAHGPVLELVTTPRFIRFFEWPLDRVWGRGAGRRMIRWGEGGEGFCDVAAISDTDDFASYLGTLRRTGLPFGRALRWQRRKPNGQLARFQFAYPENPCVPFVVTPYDPPQRPSREAHSNGARGVARVWMGVRPEDMVAVRRLLGADPVVVLEEAAWTAVRALELAGLSEPLDPALLHGAVLRPAESMRVPLSVASDPS